MNAAPADQRRLLDVAELDDRLARAHAARQNPPHAARVRELAAERTARAADLSRLLGVREDLRTDLGRVESDVAVVDARTARDAERLQVVTSPKDAQGLEHEIASLAKRKSDLEDAQLEVLESLDEVDRAVAAAQALVAETNAEGARLSAEGRAAVAQAETDAEAAGRDRAAVAASIPPVLLTLYDRLRARSAGAALLRRGTCEGCRMVLAGSDLGALRHAADDEVITCPECGAILVRTEESGLRESSAGESATT